MPHSTASWPITGPASLFLTLSEVCTFLSTNSKVINRLIKEGRFPPGIREGQKSPLRWRGEDVAAYLWLRSRGAMPREEDSVEEAEE